MAPSAGTLRVGRYFAVLLGLFVVLYGIVFWPHQPRTPKLGLDLQGGAQVILKAADHQRQGAVEVRAWTRPARSSPTGSTASACPRPRWSPRATTGSWCRCPAPAPTTSRTSAAPRCCSSGRCCWPRSRSAPAAVGAVRLGRRPARPAPPRPAASLDRQGRRDQRPPSRPPASPSAHGRVVPHAAGSAPPSGTATPSGHAGRQRPAGSATGSASAVADRQHRHRAHRSTSGRASASPRRAPRRRSPRCRRPSSSS